MGRRRPIDFINWTLYRRSLLVPAAALLVLLATSFRAEEPVTSTLPPTLANEQAGQLIEEAAQFDQLFPDRRASTAGAVDSAQWMRDEFTAMHNLTVRTVPATTQDPATGRSVGLVNVEAVLPGRTRELVVVYAHRDTADAHGRGSDAVGQMALLSLARELADTRDRRRSYLFVSTDGATLNGGGARALATRLASRGAVVAAIGIDRIGADGRLRLDASPSALEAPSLGLVQAAAAAVQDEGGAATLGSLLSQVTHLAMPVTLREHGQLLRHGIPAVTVTAGDDQLRDDGDAHAADAAVGAGLRSVQRLLTTLDDVDQLQSAGRTWIATDRRVYRGWALKIFVAALLVPVWIAAVDMLVRHRRGWNLAATLGTCVRAMLAGMSAVVALWLFGAIGVMPGSTDRPPNPGRLDDVAMLALIAWGIVAVGAWLLARGPDWRRQRAATGPAIALGPDTPELVVGFLLLVVASVLALAVSPYTVLFAVPALHVWMCMASWRVVFDAKRSAALWAAGLVGPVLAVFALAARAETGAGSLWYGLQLLQTRTVPPMLGLLMGASGGLVALLLVASLGRVAHPALPGLRATAASLLDGDVAAVAGTSAHAHLRALVALLRVPQTPTGPRRRAEREARAPRASRTPADGPRNAAERERERQERARSRDARRSRVRAR